MSSAEDASQQGRVVDAAPDNWVDRFAPALMRPYLRIARADRPIGGWLLALPGLQGLALAGGAVRWDFEQLAITDWPSAVWLFAAFFVGAFIMRGAGCVLNDIVDRDIDAKVDRTRSRPLPSGQVSLGGAFLVLVVLRSRCSFLGAWPANISLLIMRLLLRQKVPNSSSLLLT